VNELSEILNLKNAPASKILKVGPAPRTIFPPPPVIPKKNELKRNRDRSNSPTPSKKRIPSKVLKRERSISPDPKPQNQHHPLIRRNLSGNWKKRKKGKKDKEKEES